MKTVQKTVCAAAALTSAEAASAQTATAGLVVLLVGDLLRCRRLLAFGLAGENDVVGCADSPDALDPLFGSHRFDVVLLDWDMKTASAETMLDRLRAQDPDLPVIVTVEDGPTAVAAQALGADCCLAKPFSIDELKLLLTTTARAKLSVPAPAATKAPPAKSEQGNERAAHSVFDSRSDHMLGVLQVVRRVAPTSANVLLLGENGTGKTALARGIHERSQRSGRPFVTVNCPCLQARLLESDLFGHVRGAFTGAVGDTRGKVAVADGGTLFLDEIGDLSLEIQAKLLRLLQDRCYERLGETRTYQADIRVLAATNRDLREEVQAGRFRQDLFYRLNVITLEVPSLRRRREDILPIARDFLREFSGGRKRRDFSPAACRALLEHAWPGNLRELRNVVERAAILSDRDVLELADLPAFIEQPHPDAPQVGDLVSLEELAQAHIRGVLARTQTLGHAAEVLCINPTTLYRKRKRLPFATAVPFAVPAAV